ncbi:hypothetical protein AAG906_013553 [Vitis piasezkii]
MSDHTTLTIYSIVSFMVFFLAIAQFKKVNFSPPLSPPSCPPVSTLAIPCTGLSLQHTAISSFAIDQHHPLLISHSILPISSHSSNSSIPSIIQLNTMLSSATTPRHLFQPLPMEMSLVVNGFINSIINLMKPLIDTKLVLLPKDSIKNQGLDYFEIFSLVVKSLTIRIVLTIALSSRWPIWQLDVQNSFLNGDLHEQVFMHQPPGFINQQYPFHVCG